MVTLTGQVGVVTKQPGWYGRCVQAFTRSPAFHTVSAISETECVSAETPCIVIRPIDYFDDIEWTNVEFKTVAHRNDSVRFLRAQVDKPYAYLDVLWLIIATVMRERTPWFVKNRLIDQGQWFCSELSDAGLEAGGVNLFPHRPPCAVIPRDFLYVVEAEQAKVSVIEGSAP